MNERYGLDWKTARQFAFILAATRDFREDYECGPTPSVIAPLIGVSVALVRNRIEEMEGMGFVRLSYLNNRVVPGSISLARPGYDFLRLWERTNGPLGFAFS
jgi:hypothetical protein